MKPAYSMVLQAVTYLELLLRLEFAFFSTQCKPEHDWFFLMVLVVYVMCRTLSPVPEELINGRFHLAASTQIPLVCVLVP